MDRGRAPLTLEAVKPGRDRWLVTLMLNTGLSDGGRPAR